MPTLTYQKPSELVLPDCKALAKDSFLVIRDSPKFCPSVFLSSLIKGVLSGKASLRCLAHNMGKTLPSMSKQGLSERFSEKSSHFLLKVLEDLMRQRLEPVTESLLGAEIKRIIIEDSTQLKMKRENHQAFPSFGSKEGKTAGVKVNLGYDLLSGQVVAHNLVAPTKNDRSLGQQTVEEVITAGDLVLRDMGYQCIGTFKKIEALEAHWVSRLPPNVVIKDQNGVELGELLKRTKKTSFDMQVTIGVQNPHQCRLVAFKASPEAAERRRRSRRANAKRLGKEPSKVGLALDSWISLSHP